MWTNKNRARYDRSKLRYPSDLTDEEWGLVEPLIPPGKTGGGGAKHWTVIHAGGGERPHVHSLDWLSMARDPEDLPPKSSIDQNIDLWTEGGTLEQIHDALYQQCRDRAQRQASPTAAIIDSQSVKSAEKGGVR